MSAAALETFSRAIVPAGGFSGPGPRSTFTSRVLPAKNYAPGVTPDVVPRVESGSLQGVPPPVAQGQNRKQGLLPVSGQRGFNNCAAPQAADIPPTGTGTEAPKIPVARKAPRSGVTPGVRLFARRTHESGPSAAGGGGVSRDSMC